MDNYKIRINKILETMKFKEGTSTHKNAVFVNKPIQSASDDLIGFDFHIDSIKAAIDNGATAIGVISDYGTGKSSLTDIICLDDNKNYSKSIKVNLWDCLKESTNANDQKVNNISLLTKSFLFQLAAGYKKTNFAKHINKRLSKNYGMISFSITSHWFWFWLVLAVLSYGVFLVFDSLPLEFTNIFLIQKTAKYMMIFESLKYVRPLFLVFSLLSVVRGVKDTDIAFSLWDSQGKREPEVNDVFDIYLDIIEKLYKSEKKKKQLIIIEDLDRVSDKKVVVDFLHEIYRFNNLLSKKLRDKFVFVIAVKPEIILKTEGKISDKSDEIYPKIFDYTINLKPLHNEDYKSIVIKLLEKNETAVKAITNINDFKELPKEFEWILIGNNLTVRDLKQRLNQGLLLFGVLKSKSPDEKSVDLGKCMAVSYLENAFQKEYFGLIEKEDMFSEIVEYSYQLKNDSATTNSSKERLIGEKLLSLYENKEERAEVNDFYQLIAKLLMNGTIDNEFRMYFYSYPKGSHIKSTDEKFISNLIELPISNKKIENIDEVIARLGAKADKAIIESYSSLMRRELPLPSIVLENNKMFSIAAQKGDSIFKAGNVIKAEEVIPEQIEHTQMTLELEPDKELEKAYKQTNLDKNDTNDALFQRASEIVVSEVLQYIRETKVTAVTSEQTHKILETVKEKFIKDKDLGDVYKENETPLAAWLLEKTIEVHHHTVDKFIPIPKIKITDAGVEKYVFMDFDLELSEFIHVPIKNEMLIQNLEDISDRERIKCDSISFEGYNPKKVILEQLRAKPEIDYEKCSTLLFKLIAQVCDYYDSKYGSNGVQNIVMMYKRDIGNKIYKQMLQHFYCENGFLQEEVIGTKDCNTSQHYNYLERVNLYAEYREKLQSVLFDGIKKGVFNSAKFDSLPELTLARIIESDSDVSNWLRPSPKEFKITYNRGRNYEPDFVVETKDAIFLVEVKGEDRINDPDVIAKKNRAVQYCEVASRWSNANGYKKWQYLFIPANQIKSNSSFSQLANQFLAQ